MRRVVELIHTGRHAGKYLAQVQFQGTTVNIKKFNDELEAHAYLNDRSDTYFARYMLKAGHKSTFDQDIWESDSKTQINEIASKYIYMKKNLSSEQAAAIQHFAQTNPAVPQLSQFPNVTFKYKSTGDTVVVSLMTLVATYQRDKDETARTKAAEKRRQDNEQKWKPTLGKYSS